MTVTPHYFRFMLLAELDKMIDAKGDITLEHYFSLVYIRQRLRARMAAEDALRGPRKRARSGSRLLERPGSPGPEDGLR